MSQQEDDLRALAKIMDFLRAVSIILVVIHLYWYCYEAVRLWGIGIGVVDRVLMNFDRTHSLHEALCPSSARALVPRHEGCQGGENHLAPDLGGTCRGAGAVLRQLVGAVPAASGGSGCGSLHRFDGGGLCLPAHGGHMDEPPFAYQPHGRRVQCRERELHAGNPPHGERVFRQSAHTFLLMENGYSVNLPTRFYYRKKWNNGYINVVNPFRATIVLGTPGSGKSYAVVNSFIKQQIEKGFAMYIYDFKFSDLSTIAYNHLLNHMDAYRVRPKFYVINFDDPRRSHRCNPIHPDFMEDITDAYESAYTIMLNLNKTWV